jgi:hypothetical protein
MKTTVLNILRKKGMIIFILFAFLFALEAYAQYGTSRRVARRTARRTSARYSGGYGGGYGYGAPGAGYVNTLPGGCVLRAITGINYQYCGGTYYRPYYEGTTVVYEVVDENNL